MDIPKIDLNLSFWTGTRMPIYSQSEATECGIVCLAMVSTYWGHEIDMLTMRERFPVSSRGSTLKDLRDIARIGFNLQGRQVKATMEGVSALKLPCILHWDGNHFVVLKKFDWRGKAILHDPAIGRLVMTLSELSNHFSGSVLEVSPGLGFERKRESQKIPLRGLMGHQPGIRRNMSQQFVLALCLQAFVLASPWFMQLLIDDALVSGDRTFVTTLCLGFIFLALMQMAFTATRSWYTTAYTTHLNFHGQGNAFSHLMHLSPKFFENRHVGDIVSRFGSIPVLQRGMTTQVVEAAIDGIMVVGGAAMMLLYSPKLALLSCIAVILYCIMRIAMRNLTREATGRQIMAQAEQQSYFLESARSIPSIKLNGKEEARTEGWLHKQGRQINAETRLAKLGLVYSTVSGVFQIERYIIIALAAYMVLDKQFTVGALVGFLAYKDQFSGHVSSLIDKAIDLWMLPLQAQRVAEILLSPAEEQIDIEIDPAQINPRIEFKNVSYRYGKGPLILDEVSFVIEPGEFVAFIGPSGCGKSTLVKLMVGLLTPTKGEILFGDKDVTHLKWHNVRKIMGTVMQDDTLMRGSIREAITGGEADPDLPWVVECAKRAAIAADIAAMPMDDRTPVGDLGSSLSGGQRQRVMLARAFYRKPKILILDEATSSLDDERESFINDAISRTRVTRVIVAHRKSTYIKAQRILALANGKLLAISAVVQIRPESQNEPLLV